VRPPSLLHLFLASAVTSTAGAASNAFFSIPVLGTAALHQPIAIYNNWSAYDELSDRIELTEALAMKELGEIVRLRRAGVRIDYYLMDAFWYSTNGGYREFRRPHWPNGPETWLEACRTSHIKPGLWLASNVPFRIEPLPEWRSSMDATGSAMTSLQMNSITLPNLGCTLASPIATARTSLTRSLAPSARAAILSRPYSL